MNFLSKKSVGLDIDDESIKLVALSGARPRVKIFLSTRVALPAGAVQNGVIQNRSQVVTALKQLLAKAGSNLKLDEIVFGLPNSQIFPAIAELKINDDKHFKDAVWQSATTNLPFEASDLLLANKVLTQQGNNYQVLLLGASRQVLSSWQDVLTSVGAKVAIFDIGSYALARDLINPTDTNPMMIVDIGSSKTNMFVFVSGNLAYSYDCAVGGRLLTDKISSALQIDASEAETKKLAQGLDSQILPIVTTILESLVKEIKSASAEYLAVSGRRPTSIQLVGGGANLSGLADYLTRQLGLSCQNGVPASSKVAMAGEFIEAYGLALRALTQEHFSQDPLIELSSEFPVTTESGLDNGADNFMSDVVNQRVPVVDDKTERSTGVAVPVSDEISEIVKSKDRSQKLAWEKKILLIIVIFGLIVVGGAYWYRRQHLAVKNSQETAVITFAKIQTFPFKLMIVTETNSYAENKVRGRIINDRLESAKDFDEALNLSRRKIAQDLLANEELWMEPLNEIIDKSQLSYPLTLRWLVFDKQDVVKIALADIDKSNVNKLPYAFNDIKKTKVEKTDLLGVVYLYGQISISLNEEITSSSAIDLGTSKPAEAVVSGSPEPLLERSNY